MFCITLLAWFGSSPAAFAKSMSIGLLYDGPIGNSIISDRLIQNEIRSILEPDYQVKFVARAGNWNSDTVEQELSTLLGDAKIDIIITMGIVGSHIAGKRAELAKPVVASFVPDPTLQQLPLSVQQTSGKTTYVYTSFLQNVSEPIKQVLAVLPADNLRY